MADDNIGGDNTPTIEQLQAEIAKWQGEAKNAFKDRDGLKNKLRDLEGKVMSDEDRELFKTLRAQQETLEEEKKRKAGEFDTWRTQITEKHSKDLKAEQEKTAAALEQATAREKDLHNTLIGLAFSSASEWFGDNGKTVLPPSIAQSHLARYVDVQTDETSGDRTVIVKNVSGAPILDTKTGAPLEFGKAIGELIDSLPEKARILRGSGKAGSGNNGGGDGIGGKDLSRLTAADFADPKVRDAVRKNMATAGGLRIGPGFDALQAQKKR